MNMAAVITASVFLAFAIGVLIFLFVGKTSLSTSKIKNFYRASAGVYVSGALLILVFALVMKGLPVAFVVISDVTILFVFCFTVGLMYFMTKSIVEAAAKAQAKSEEQKQSTDDENKE